MAAPRAAGSPTGTSRAAPPRPRRRPAPRWPPPARRRPWPRAAAARSPRTARGRRTRPRRPAGGPTSSTQPSRRIRSRWPAAAMAALQSRFAPAARSGDDEIQIGMAAATSSKAADQPGEVLAGLDGAEAEHVRADRAAAVHGVERQGAGVDAGWTTRTRSGSAPNCSTTSSATAWVAVWTHGPVGDGPADEGRVAAGRRGAQLGKAHRGEVLDGHHPGGPPGRWHDEVGPVDHVDAAASTIRRPAGRTGHSRSRAAAAMGARTGRTPGGRAAAQLRPAPSS